MNTAAKGIAYFGGDDVPYSGNYRGWGLTEGLGSCACRRSAGTAVFACIATVEEVEEPGEIIPFAVGQTVKNGEGESVEIVAIDSRAQIAGVVHRGRDCLIRTYDERGRCVKSRQLAPHIAPSVFDLIPNRHPGRKVRKLVRNPELDSLLAQLPAS